MDRKLRYSASAWFVALFAMLLIGGSLVGCGGESDRYEVSGTVTFHGRPVPGGRILFVPDRGKGNAGTGSVAEIHEGKYRTRTGKGSVGGPHQVTIYGDDGTMPTETTSNALFPPYRATVELPHAEAHHNFAIPAN